MNSLNLWGRFALAWSQLNCKAQILVRLAVLVWSLVLPGIAFAQTSEKCDFVVTCDKTFSLEFKSKSGDCSEDDVTVTFVRGNKRTLTGIKADWYFEMANIGNVRTSCKSTNYEGYPIYFVDNKALIFLRSSGRPSSDRISVALVETKSGKIIDHIDVGTYRRQSFGVLKTDRGYKFQMEKSYLKEMACDCDAAYVEGWMEVGIENKKLFKRWL